MGLDPEAFGNASDPGKWPKLKEAIGARLLTKPRDEWARLLEPYDPCFAPVLAMAEAPNHPHHLADRKSVVQGKSVSVRVAIGGRRTINQKIDSQETD